MRIGGLISDYLGEVRLAEPEAFEGDFLGSGLLVKWKGGRCEMGYPLGMPLGVDAGIAFQVYSAGSLVAATSEPLAILERSLGTSCFEVLGVATHLAAVAQPNVLERGLGRRVKLAWPAAASADVAAYLIYSDDRTGTVDYSAEIAEVSGCEWTSDELDSGPWRFGVRAVDSAGNIQESPAIEAEAVIAAPPDPPSGLACAYSAVTRAATLSWPPPARWT